MSPATLTTGAAALQGKGEVAAPATRCAYALCTNRKVIELDGWPFCRTHAHEHPLDQACTDHDWDRTFAATETRSWGEHTLLVTSREHHGRLQWQVGCTTCRADSGLCARLSEAFDTASRR